MIKKQILVIGTDSVFCHAIESQMQDSSTEIFCISSAAEALEQFMKQEYCLVIMDFQHPEMDGGQMLRAMKAVRNTPILVLTESIASSEKVALFQAGANACIDKPIDIMMCAAQAKALIQIYMDSGLSLDSSVPITYGTELKIDPIYHQVTIDGCLLNLTKTEFSLLFCLARYPGRLWSREQLYHHIWDDHFDSCGENTVRTHIGNLRKKLTVAGKSYIQNIRGIGYRFDPPVTDYKK